MEHIPETRRRGRPAKTEADPVSSAPLPAAAQDAAPDGGTEGAASPVKRRRRASVGGHALKLNAPPRPGYTRRWVNDLDNRIAQADDLAYDFVNEKGIKTDDPSSRVSRLVGTKANGEPLRAYLMETPDELYAEGVAEKEAHNAQVDEAIRAGSYSEGQGDANTFGQGSIKVER